MARACTFYIDLLTYLRMGYGFYLHIEAPFVEFPDTLTELNK